MGITEEQYQANKGKGYLKPYWKNRILAQNEANYKRTVNETQKALTEINETQAKDVQQAILDVFAKMEADAGTEHGIMLNDLYRNERYWALLRYLNENLNALGKGEIEILEPKIVKAYEDTVATLEHEVPKTLIRTQFLNTNAIDAAQIVHHVWCLDGKEFSDRVWDDKAKLLQTLKKQMEDAVVQGKSSWEVAKQIRDKVGQDSYCSYRIARTEICHAQIKGQTDKYKQMGFRYGKFLGSKTCCDECHDRDGKLYTLDDLENLIPVHPHCTCTFTLVTE